MDTNQLANILEAIILVAEGIVDTSSVPEVTKSPGLRYLAEQGYTRINGGNTIFTDKGSELYYGILSDLEKLLKE